MTFRTLEDLHHDGRYAAGLEVEFFDGIIVRKGTISRQGAQKYLDGWSYDIIVDNFNGTRGVCASILEQNIARVVRR